MQPPAFVARSLGRAAFEFAQLQPFIPTYAHLLASAIFPIYAGAHSSLSRPFSAAKQTKKKAGTKEQSEDEEEEDDVAHHMEGLSPQDALLFPVLAGLTLTGLYFLIKWLQDPTLLNKLLGWYFATFSAFSVSRFVSDGLDVLHSILFPHDYIDGGIFFHIDPKKRLAIPLTPAATARKSPLPGIFSRIPLPVSVLNSLWALRVLPNRKFHFKAFIRRVLHADFRLGIHGIEGLFVGLSTVLWYNFISKPWWLSNLMGFGFAYGALQLMSPTTFWTGTLILCGLFFYDIYFVFYTPMMVTVATSLDVPIKLLFPRPPEPDSDPSSKPMSMLGLGDIVLPGIMIGLALRFDLYMFYLRKQTEKASPPAKAFAEDDSEVDAIQKDNKDNVESSHEMGTVKAPYRSVANGWGDRLWTSSWITGWSSTHGYVARNAFPKPYFNASLVGYLAGMLTTVAAMQLSNHPQPALLYLVPGVLTSLWGTAWARNEIKDMWHFSDAVDDEEGVEKKKTDGSKKDETSESKQRSTAKANQTSFFSFDRTESRSRRLEKAVNESASNLSDGTGEDESTKRDEDEYAGKWFSLSVKLPHLKDQFKAGQGSNEAASGESSSRYSLRSQETHLRDRAEKRQRVS